MTLNNKAKMGLNELVQKLFLGATLAVTPHFINRSDATTIIIGITGKVDYVEDYVGALENKINIGDVIRGVYSYDSETPDSSADPHYGLYEYKERTPYGISLEVGGLFFKTDPDDADFFLSISDCPKGQDNISDSYFVYSGNNLSLPCGEPVYSITWQINFHNNPWNSEPYTNDDLPVVPPDLDRWGCSDWGIKIRGEHGNFSGKCADAFYIHAPVNSVEIIPEPSTISLLGLGSLALLYRKRKLIQKRRKKQTPA